MAVNFDALPDDVQEDLAETFGAKGVPMSDEMLRDTLSRMSARAAFETFLKLNGIKPELGVYLADTWEQIKDAES